ncbi:MAG: HPr family phosphocarrier protein [Alphaproteobacteria bacterium]|nr:HPr family phosphocarrier protein [Alphaproteobacteria bacterium]
MMMDRQGLCADELCEMVVLVNKRGLHARAAAKLVQVASAFKADVHVAREDMKVPASSIMGLMMLAAPCGTCVKLCASGIEAVDALNALVDLIMRGFDEE